MSLTNKITILFLGAIIIPSIFIFSVIYYNQEEIITDVAISNLKEIVQLQKSRIIAADPNSSVLADVLKNYVSLGKTGEVLVLSSKNGSLSLINPPRFSEEINEVNLNKMLAEVSSVIRNGETQINLIDYRGNMVIAVIEPIPELSLVLMGKKDASEIKQPLQNISNYFLLAFFIISIIGIFGGLSISRSLADPLRQLSFSVAEFTKNPASNIVIPINSKDEAGDLARNFNIMAERIKNYYRDMELAVAERTTSLSNLAAQLKSKIEDVESANKATLNIMADLKIEKESLAKANAKEDAILSSIGDGIFASDETGRIIRINASLLRMLGYKEKEALGERMISFFKLSDLKTGTEIPSEDRPLIEALTTGEPVSGVFYVTRKDKSKFAAAITASPIMLNHVPTGVIQTVRDVTHEIEIDKAKSEFVSLASHQLRTPLSAINWYAEMLIAGDAGPVNNEQKKYLDEIYQGNQRMVELVNALLDASRLELGIFIVEPKPTDLIALAESVINELVPQITKKKQTLNKDYGASLPNINVDVKLMRMIFQNLLSNAVKYTPAGGTVTLSIKKEDDNIVIKVADTGIGIPDIQKGKIFVKLFRADNARDSDAEGTGLGLYIIKSVLDQTGGKIWFDSEENQGTVFYVTLPLSGMRAKSGSKELETISR